MDYPPTPEDGKIAPKQRHGLYLFLISSKDEGWQGASYRLLRAPPLGADSLQVSKSKTKSKSKSKILGFIFLLYAGDDLFHISCGVVH